MSKGHENLKLRWVNQFEDHESHKITERLLKEYPLSFERYITVQPYHTTARPARAGNGAWGKDHEFESPEGRAWRPCQAPELLEEHDTETETD